MLEEDGDRLHYQFGGPSTSLRFRYQFYALAPVALPITPLASLGTIGRPAPGTKIRGPPPTISASWPLDHERDRELAGCLGVHDVCNEEPRRHGAQVVKFVRVPERCVAEEDDGHALADAMMRPQMSLEVKNSGA